MTAPGAAPAAIPFPEPKLFRELLGQHDEHVKLLERQLGIRIDIGDGTLTPQGDPIETELATRVLTQLYGLLEQGYPIYASDVEYALRILSGDRSARLRDIFLDTVFISSNRRTITPKSIAQKAYIDAIRNYDLVFGVGPAGTGKTYLAMAMAVAELMKSNFTRIVLARPAVEAGEKLGFLPGDLAEKVNPYLRPLYDALHDMVDFDRARKMVERGRSRPKGWRRSATSTPSATTTSSSASGRRAPARPTSRWRSPSGRCSRSRSSASCSRGRPSRRASGWASCPGAWRRRSRLTCGRSTTRSTT